MGAASAFVLSGSYIAYLKSNIHSKEALILSVPELICFFRVNFAGPQCHLCIAGRRNYRIHPTNPPSRPRPSEAHS